MFVKRDFSTWNVDAPVATLQEEALKQGDPDLSFFDEMKTSGYELLESYIAQSERRLRSFSEVYTFETLPDSWPLKLVRHIANNLPATWRDKLKAVKIGLVAIEDVNALAWPTVGNIAILNGIANFFLLSCYAAGPYRAFSLHGMVDPAKELAESITCVAAECLLAPPGMERLAALARLYHYRSKLAVEFPENRQHIESFAALYANSAILFIIMHELSHVVSNHKPKEGSASQAQECQADSLATEVSIQLGSEYSSWFIAGALSMSLLEVHDRLAGATAKDGVKAKPDDTHPSPYQRRKRILDHGTHVLRQKKVAMNEYTTGLAIAHLMHIELSVLLLRNGFDPLLPFLSPVAAAAFGVSGVPNGVLNVPRKIVAIEDSPSLGISLE